MTLGAYAAPYISAEDSALFPILGLGYPVLLLCNVIAVIVWLLAYRKYTWLSIITLILGYGSCTKLINVSLPDQNVNASFRVATYNSNFLKPIAFTEENKRPALEKAFEEYLHTLDLDVLCVQEHGWRTEQHIEEALDFEYKHEVENMTVAIYSRFPFIATGIVDFDSNVANTCIWADLLIHGDTIRVYTTHLESNRETGTVPEVIEQEAPERMDNLALFGIVRHFQKFSAARVEQARRIQAHKMTAPYPVVICGDLNDTPQSYVYTIARGDMQDSFLEEGLGMGSTFGERIPALRIDYIFADEAIEVLDHDINRSQYSDHYVVISQLVVD